MGVVGGEFAWEISRECMEESRASLQEANPLLMRLAYQACWIVSCVCIRGIKRSPAEDELCAISALAKLDLGLTDDRILADVNDFCWP